MPKRPSLQARENAAQPNSERSGPANSKAFPVVGIGASAGGLDSCSKLVDALPALTGMAFILVQHLDPTHPSMMADLLGSHTKLQVCEAADGMVLEIDHLYVIPPASYLSVVSGVLRLSKPEARHGARMPFDYLLQSMALELGGRAIAVVLSGTGADGSVGVKSIREKGGLVIAQYPEEAGFDGMPRNAIQTGAVDLILPARMIWDALLEFLHRKEVPRITQGPPQAESANFWLQQVIELLHARTSHDFRLYKPGTLQRRLERRMAMAAIPPADKRRYLDLLQTDEAELSTLATDLLINVTSFFRDQKVFDALSKTIIPDLLNAHNSDRPLRIWIAGCSTGEEAYSIAILFHEAIESAGRNIKLQIFASDTDPDAIATAREGVYSEAIVGRVSKPRLARFFTKLEHGYKVTVDLREKVVFTVQDLLSDPPFSRLDMISCRNVLIYLKPEAQIKLISLFHFALRKGGILLLGSAEAIGEIEGRFEVLFKNERLFRHIGGNQLQEFEFSSGHNAGLRVPSRVGLAATPLHHANLAELCHRLVLENYAPAAVLINKKHECIYSIGPIERYLRPVKGIPSLDIFDMIPLESRSRLRGAIIQANAVGKCISIGVPSARNSDHLPGYVLDVRLVEVRGDKVHLICFIDKTSDKKRSDPGSEVQLSVSDDSRLAALEQELQARNSELQQSNHALELMSEDQRAINEEAMSINEEYQSTNEELTTSKEELQSLNEELTALNSQLQETLERQRTTFNDMQNILYSTDVATIFLDENLNIRFFTPATKALFNIIAGDVGRPLADLSLLAFDNTLLADARDVLSTNSSVQREIEATTGLWYNRRIMPYRTPDNSVAGVVITFSETTERKLAADTLGAAKRQAELATIAKSRFLAAASHDLRQPLQALVLLQGLLSKSIDEPKAQKLLQRLDETLGTMSGMLNALLDINQIEAGNVRAEMVEFPIGAVLEQLRVEFKEQAQSQGIVLKVIPCSLVVNSDQRLLEQMIRNLLSNAFKYTNQGKVLLGCRRRNGKLSIELWDTGIGIAAEEFRAIFDEYHQIDNAARERARGLGLGLFIVQRLATLLKHTIHVRSRVGIGSVFSIDILNPHQGTEWKPAARMQKLNPVSLQGGRNAKILLVEDDEELRQLLEFLLQESGYVVSTAADGVSALLLVTRDKFRPDLLLADFNLPNSLNGLQLAMKLRQIVQPGLPVIILTGDISTETLSSIADQQCVQLNKPIKASELDEVIVRLLRLTTNDSPAVPQTSSPGSADFSGDEIVVVIDDDQQVRELIRDVLEDSGRTVECYADSESFLSKFHPRARSCLLVDAYLPGMNGVELLQKLNDAGQKVAAIVITGNSDVPMAVKAMKAGALDFLEKPISNGELLAGVARALEHSQDAQKAMDWHDAAAKKVATLTARQRQIMTLVLAGHPSKNIAADLGISQRTVENHRASIMKRTGAKSLPALARLAIIANSGT